MALSDAQKMTYAKIGYAASPDWYLGARDAGRERKNIPWDDLDEYDQDQLGERVGAVAEAAQRDLIERMLADAEQRSADGDDATAVEVIASYLPTEKENGHVTS